MTISEVLKAANPGQRIKRRGRACMYWFGGGPDPIIKWGTGNDANMFLDDMVADDWEIVRETKTVVFEGVEWGIGLGGTVCMCGFRHDNDVLIGKKNTTETVEYEE